MDTNTEERAVQAETEEQKKSIDRLKASKLILCGINAIAMLVYTCLSESYNAIGIACVIIILGWRLARTLGDAQRISASAFLPVFVLTDAICIMVLHWEELKFAYEADLLNGWHYLEGFGGTCLWIMLFGCTAIVIGCVKAQLTWLSGIGGGAFCASIILWMWSNQDFEDLRLVPEGEVFLSFVIGFSVFWAFLAQFISITEPQYRSKVHKIGLTLLCLFFVYAVVGAEYTGIMAEEWAATLVKWGEAFSQWHIVILSTVLLLFMAAGAFAFSKDYLGIDCMACASFASLILAARIVKAFPFTFSTLLMIALMCFTLKWVANERAQKNTFQLDNLVYYPVQFGAFVASVILLHNGLWMAFLVSVAWGIALYVMYTRSEEKRNGNAYWILVLVGIAAFTASWLWQFRFSAEAMKMLVFILVLSIAALLLVSRKQPGGDKKAAQWPRKLICQIMALLCLFMMGRNGSSINIETGEHDYAVVHMAARGKDNVIDRAEAVWCDKMGAPISEPITLKDEEERLQLESELLRVTVVDDNGIRTTRDFFLGT